MTRLCVLLVVGVPLLGFGCATSRVASKPRGSPAYQGAEAAVEFVTWADPFFEIVHRFELCLESKKLIKFGLVDERKDLPGMLTLVLDIDAGFKPLDSKLTFEGESRSIHSEASSCVKAVNREALSIFTKHYDSYLVKTATTTPGRWSATSTKDPTSDNRYDLKFEPKN